MIVEKLRLVGFNELADRLKLIDGIDELWEKNKLYKLLNINRKDKSLTLLSQVDIVVYYAVKNIIDNYSDKECYKEVDMLLRKIYNRAGHVAPVILVSNINRNIDTLLNYIDSNTGITYGFFNRVVLKEIHSEEGFYGLKDINDDRYIKLFIRGKVLAEGVPTFYSFDYLEGTYVDSKGNIKVVAQLDGKEQKYTCTLELPDKIIYKLMYTWRT